MIPCGSVRSVAARQAAQAAGFDLIEGDWFVHDPQPGGDRVDPAYASVLRALGLTHALAHRIALPWHAPWRAGPATSACSCWARGA